jgi:TetR/AcrR family transcriptional regulator, regulator of mycofactocin system
VVTVEGKTDLLAPSLVQQVREKRSELMISELEAVALALFDERGFNAVTVDEIAAEAQISARTFYRYFPAKEDVLQVRIRRRADALKAALAERPSDEPPLHSLRVAIEVAVAAEDPMLVGRWISVVAATPNVLKGVVGGFILTTNRMMAEFFGSRLGLPSDALVPSMLAAAAGGVIQAAQTRWFLQGGNLETTISEGLQVLEAGVGTDLVTRGGGQSAGKRRG